MKAMRARTHTHTSFCNLLNAASLSLALMSTYILPTSGFVLKIFSIRTVAEQHRTRIIWGFIQSTQRGKKIQNESRITFCQETGSAGDEEVLGAEKLDNSNPTGVPCRIAAAEPVVRREGRRRRA
jgi:hypothetical protein